MSRACSRRNAQDQPSFPGLRFDQEPRVQSVRLADSWLVVMPMVWWQYANWLGRAIGSGSCAGASQGGSIMDHKLSTQEVADLCKKDYIVIEASGQGELMARVNQMREFGFVPVGGITKMQDASRPKLWQAMQRNG